MAIVTEALRRDNHVPLRFFTKIAVVHLFGRAPYGDMTKDELAGAVRYTSYLDVYRKLIGLRPQVIQGSEPYASRRSLILSIAAARAARALHVPLVFPTLENMSPRERFGPVVGAIVERYFAAYGRQAAHILALNNGAAANVRAAGIPDAKIIRFPWGIWGVDRTVFKPSQKIPHSAFKSPSVLFAGRLDPEKGVMDLLHAFALLTPDYPDWQLVLVGRGILDEEINIFVRANRLSARVHRIDWIPSRELPPYLSAARVVVYPSVTARRGTSAAIQGWSEQVGTVILQSLACGTPVVGTRSGAIPEYLDKGTGLLVSEHNPEELAGAIKRIMTDESLRARLSRNGQGYIAQHFDAKKNVERAESMVLSWLNKPTTNYRRQTTASD
jgi:glycosyltransferase involved in cell wall biosynthesis